MERRDGKLMLTPRGADFINGVIPLFYSQRSKEELVRLYERKRDPANEGEKVFLETYSIEKFDRPSVATDVVAMTIGSVVAGNYRSPRKEQLSVLLIRRGEHPYFNQWALPGGFLRHGEAVEHCAQRELFEEAGLNVNALYPLGCFSAPGRDPRSWILSNAFLSIVGKEERTLMFGDDAIDARWFTLQFEETDGTLRLSLTHDDIRLAASLKIQTNAFGQHSFEPVSSSLAFDHATIIATALKALQAPEGLRRLSFAFLPDEFTINELQTVHELLLGKPLLTANFRRKTLPLLTAVGRTTAGDGHRPAAIYTKN